MVNLKKSGRRVGKRLEALYKSDSIDKTTLDFLTRQVKFSIGESGLSCTQERIPFIMYHYGILPPTHQHVIRNK